MTVHNSSQKDAWSAELYNKNASFVYSPAFTSAVLQLLEAKVGEKILDLGCGSGEITVELQKVVGDAGYVAGFDSSPNMIEKAKLGGVKNAFVADAQALSFPSDIGVHEGKFDAVFTNATLHWCKRDPAGVIRGVAKALKHDGQGRFVGETGGYLNCIGIRSALRTVLKARGQDGDSLDPWFFPSIEEYRKLLEDGGFEVHHISLTPRITPLPGPAVDWLMTFCRESVLKDLGDAEAEQVMNEVQDMYAIDGRDSAGRWSIMYVRLRFAAVLKA